MKDKFEAAMEYISGSIMIGPFTALQVILERRPTDQEEDAFEKFLDDNECYPCEYCGWYTNPGEVCDCEEECSECGHPQGECECV